MPCRNIYRKNLHIAVDLNVFAVDKMLEISEIPRYESLSSNISLFNVSKAFGLSKNTTTGTFPSCIKNVILYNNYIAVTSVECLRLNPY